MECPVMRVSQLEVLQTLVGLDESVPDDLYLGLVGDRFQVWVEDAAFCVDCFAVSVVFGGRVEALCEFVLRFGCDFLLVFEDYYVVVV